MLETHVEFKEGKFKNVEDDQCFPIEKMIIDHLRIEEGATLSIKIWWTDKEINVKIVPENVSVSYRQIEMHVLKIIRRDEHSKYKDLIKEIVSDSQTLTSLIENLRKNDDGDSIFTYLIELSSYYVNGGTKTEYLSTYGRYIDIKSETEYIRAEKTR